VQLKTLLNACHRLKGFVYAWVAFERVGLAKAVVAEVRPRRGSRAVCSGCGRAGPTYDTSAKPRLFQFVPIWGFHCYLRYSMRRVDCPRCGATVERVPWAEGKSPLTKAFEAHLARWARRLSWKQVAEAFHTSWDAVFRSVRRAVDHGLRHRDLEGIEAIGVDEWCKGKGHDYVTLVYQIDAGRRRLLHVAEKRTVKSLQDFFAMLGERRAAAIRHVCSDMWKPYLKVIAERLPQAIHILDRFHIVANLNKALDEVRAAEARKLKAEGYTETLKHTKYCFAKNPENLTGKQKARLKDVLKLDLRSVRAYLLKESFQMLWRYDSPRWARWFLKKWCFKAARSQLGPIKRFVKSVRRHEDLIVNYFEAKKALSSGIVEGLNRNVNLATSTEERMRRHPDKAYGFRTYKALEVCLYHNLGDLPEPESTHEFF